MTNYTDTQAQLNLTKENLQFEKNGSIIISGIATTNSKDREGGGLRRTVNGYLFPSNKITITPNALKNALPDFYKNKAPLMVDHGMGEQYRDRVVGEVMSLDYEPKEYDVDSPMPPKMKITFVARVDDEELIEEVLTGKKGFVSLRWKTQNFYIHPKTEMRVDTEVTLTELSVTANPKNKEAKFNVVRDEDLERTFFKRGEEVEIQNAKAFVKEIYEDNGNFLYDLEFDDGWNFKSLEYISEKRLVELSGKKVNQFQLRFDNFKSNIENSFRLLFK